MDDGDYTAFFRAEFRPVARTVYLIVHDVQRAEDITQEAFVQVLRHWRSVSGYERPGAWVRRVAIRLATRAAQREARRARLEMAAYREPPAEAADIDVMRAVGGLPPQQRAAVVLFYFEDRPVAEVADLIGCSVSAAKVTLHRARHRLAATLGEEVTEDAS